ncbi:hypothetical protein B0H34DRAFT_672922 [Crassisporium funariophilum]|nr:hypothetical protein B0H34DRAFT_672922 [Crassisporium funariophilum]
MRPFATLLHLYLALGVSALAAPVNPRSSVPRLSPNILQARQVQKDGTHCQIADATVAAPDSNGLNTENSDVSPVEASRIVNDCMGVNPAVLCKIQNTVISVTEATITELTSGALQPPDGMTLFDCLNVIQACLQSTPAATNADGSTGTAGEDKEETNAPANTNNGSNTPTGTGQPADGTSTGNNNDAANGNTVAPTTANTASTGPLEFLTTGNVSPTSNMIAGPDAKASPGDFFQSMGGISPIDGTSGLGTLTNVDSAQKDGNADASDPNTGAMNIPAGNPTVATPAGLPMSPGSTTVNNGGPTSDDKVGTANTASPLAGFGGPAAGNTPMGLVTGLGIQEKSAEVADNNSDNVTPMGALIGPNIGQTVPGTTGTGTTGTGTTGTSGSPATDEKVESNPLDVLGSVDVAGSQAGAPSGNAQPLDLFGSTTAQNAGAEPKTDAGDPMGTLIGPNIGQTVPGTTGTSGSPATDEKVESNPLDVLGSVDVAGSQAASPSANAQPLDLFGSATTQNAGAEPKTDAGGLMGTAIGPNIDQTVPGTTGTSGSPATDEKVESNPLDVLGSVDVAGSQAGAPSANAQPLDLFGSTTTQNAGAAPKTNAGGLNVAPNSFSLPPSDSASTEPIDLMTGMGLEKESAANNDVSGTPAVGAGGTSTADNICSPCAVLKEVGDQM